jgi:hypothetical protein
LAENGRIGLLLDVFLSKTMLKTTVQTPQRGDISQKSPPESKTFGAAERLRCLEREKLLLFWMFILRPLS